MEKTLTGITVTGQPSRTEYEVGDKFDPTGIEVTAAYSNGDTEVLKADAEGLVFLAGRIYRSGTADGNCFLHGKRRDKRSGTSGYSN